MPTTTNASLDSGWRSTKWCLTHKVWFLSFSYTTLLGIYVADCHCWALGAQTGWEGQLNLGCDLQVLLTLFRFWKHIKSRLKCVQPGCVKLGKDQTLSKCKKSCFIATNGKINLFVPAGDLVHTLRKSELCLDILIADWMQSANFFAF